MKRFLALILTFFLSFSSVFGGIISDLGIEWSSSGSISGKTCVQWSEAADPHTWHDNWLCSNYDFEFKWSNSARDTTMRCTLIKESADTEGTWHDNYLCIPWSSKYFLSWSSAGTLPDKDCLQITEASEPTETTWHDNYLCFSKSNDFDYDTAKKFAPVLRFDQAASTYPMDPEIFYQYAVLDNVPSSGNLGGYTRVSSDRIENEQLSDIPTYFELFTCGNQVKIVYYFWYGYQDECDVFGNGEHSGDWERVIVILSDDRTKIAAVTYHQHGGWLTKRRSRVERWGTHPLVYVGKESHGSYPNRDYHGQVGGNCLYYSDYRNPGNDDNWHTENQLVDLKLKSDPWMRTSTFYSGIGTKPQLIDAQSTYCESDSCRDTGSSTTEGCWESDCKVNHCDCGTDYCAQRCTSWWCPFDCFYCTTFQWSSKKFKLPNNDDLFI